MFVLRIDGRTEACGFLVSESTLYGVIPARLREKLNRNRLPSVVGEHKGGRPMEQDRKRYTVEEVQRLFAWRTQRKRRGPIPTELWKAATSLTREYSIYTIAKYLHLNFKELKRQMRKTDDAAEGAAPLSFIELNTISPQGVSECLIEMEKPDGAKMKICCKG